MEPDRISECVRGGLAVALVAAGLCGACGQAPARLGELVNSAGVEKSDAGPAPPDVARRGFEAPDAVVRVEHGDVLGDEAPETVAALAGGAGVEVRDAAGVVQARLETDGYLTAMALVPASRAPKRDLALYLYPDATGGGTFEVRTPGDALVATWSESPPPSHFAVAAWQGDPALVYLQGDDLVVRSPMGAPLARLGAPEGSFFTDLFATTVGGRLVLLASGNGYVPYHALFVYSGDGRLLYEDVADEQAFGLEALPGGQGVAVFARSRVWHYRLPGAR